MTKITITDTMLDATIKLAEGNAGAVQVLTAIFNDADKIQTGMPGIWRRLFMQLDVLGIYGNNIFNLASEICEKDLRKLILILRANQLGILFDYQVRAMASDRSGGSKILPDRWDEIDQKVCQYLPNFQQVKS